MTASDQFTADLPPARLWRRLMALAYDIFLIAALWIFTFFVWGFLVPPPESPDADINKVLSLVLVVILIIETWAFYAWFWLHGGQTLGMRAWKLLSRDYRRRPMTLWQTIARFVSGILSWGLAGGGYLLAVIPPHQTLHDRFSATETVVVPKAK